MVKRIKKIIVNPWTISILSPIATTGIVAIIKNINFFDAIIVIVEAIKYLMNYKISVKIILLIFLIIYIGLKLYIEILESKKEYNPKWLKYTTDKYKEWYFKWEYVPYYDKYHIGNVWPICRCGCGLSRRDRYKNAYYGNGILVCPQCESTYNTIDEECIDNFKLLIEYNIRNNNYKCIENH